MPSAAPIAPTALSEAEPRELDGFRTDRTYLGADHGRNERRTWIVAAICLATLAAQLTGGRLFHSMALTAGGGGPGREPHLRVAAQAHPARGRAA